MKDRVKRKELKVELDEAGKIQRQLRNFWFKMVLAQQIWGQPLKSLYSDAYRKGSKNTRKNLKIILKHRLMGKESLHLQEFSPTIRQMDSAQDKNNKPTQVLPHKIVSA